MLFYTKGSTTLAILINQQIKIIALIFLASLPGSKKRQITLRQSEVGGNKVLHKPNNDKEGINEHSNMWLWLLVQR